MDMKVEFVTRGCETAPITIDVTFPANYADESLRGKAAKFDVYIRDAVVYDVPEYNESFITEKLKLTAEDLSAYSGATLIEKHTEKLRAEYKKEINESNHALLSDAMWAHILSGVEIKKLPAKTVETYYNVYYGQINQYYSYYSSQYDSLDSFAITYLNSEYGANLASGADWKAYITSLAEGDTVQKLVFYYIIREENLFPSDSDYQQIYGEVYNSILESTLELHESELATLSGEEYNKKVESLKDQIDSYYGESYFREQVYYYYGSRKMLEFATVK
jgi:FKBP-type peptidyl-prolyl cis-trans isomerase (trigger factor)